MTLLVLTLFAISLGDLVAGGLAGTPRSLRAAAAGALAAAAALAAGTALTAGAAPMAWGGALAVAITAAGWPLLRAFSPAGNRSRAALGWASLAALTLALALAWTRSAGWPSAGTLASERWPAPSLDLSPERLLLAVATLLFLAAPANGIVRLTLSLAGTQFVGSEQRLRGGRFIGILERWLIFGLAIAGEPTAAALIASAKSLLRFPELTMISRSTPPDGPAPAGGPEINAVTEYLLLGSLASWFLALAAVPLWLAS